MTFPASHLTGAKNRLKTKTRLMKTTNICKTKDPFIATQLNSTRCQVELRRRVAIDTAPTQLNSTSSGVELCRLMLAASGVELRRRRYRHFADTTQLHSTSS